MTIKELKPNNHDDRGFTVEFEQARTGLQIALFRKAGTRSGRHYHKGISGTKNPEILLLLHGDCVFNWYDINKEDKAPQTLRISGPIQLEIPAYTWHEVIAETDCVFIELNSIEEHVADTFYID